MARATLTISSKNYSSWSLRGWLLCRMAGLDFEEQPVDLGDPDARQELLLLSPSVLVPRLTHDGVSVWDTLAIAEYLNEIAPEARLLPVDRAARAHCRAVSGEIHSGFYNLRSALPMNLKARHETFKIFSGARPDVERIRDDLERVPRELRRAVPVRRADGGGRDVRAGLHPVPHLCGARSTRGCGLLRDRSSPGR